MSSINEYIMNITSQLKDNEKFDSFEGICNILEGKYTQNATIVNDILKKLAMARLAEVTAKQPNPEFITIAIHNAANVLPKTKVVIFFIN